MNIFQRYRVEEGSAKACWLLCFCRDIKKSVALQTLSKTKGFLKMNK